MGSSAEGSVQQRGTGDREGRLGPPEAICSAEAKLPEEEEAEETVASPHPDPPNPPTQQEKEMKEISSGVWPGGQWTRQLLKFFHFSGNRI